MTHRLTLDTATQAGGHSIPESIDRLDVTAEIAYAVNRQVPQRELFDLIASTTARQTGHDFCAVLVEDPNHGNLVIEGSYGLSQSYVDGVNAHAKIPVRPCDAGAGPSSRAFRSLRPTTVLDVGTDTPSRYWVNLAGQEGYSSVLSVPLTVEGMPFGVLTCYSVERRQFASHEIRHLESLARQATVAIETNRRFSRLTSENDALAREAAELRAELSAVGTASAEYDHLLQVVLKGEGVRRIAAFLSATLSTSVVIDDGQGRVLAAVPSHADTLAAYTMAQLLADTTPEDRHADGGHAAAYLVEPVILHEAIVGRVWALDPPTVFGAGERRVLAKVATVVAFALLEERTAQDVEWRLSRDFLECLLEPPEGRSAETLLARARQYGADLTRPHVLLVVHEAGGQHGKAGQGAHAQRSLLAVVQRSSVKWPAATVAATRNDHIVVLWRCDADDKSALEFAEHLRREIVAHTAAGQPTVLVGPTCEQVDEYGEAYRLTCSVLDLVRQTGRTPGVVTLDDIGPYRLLLQVKRPRELHAFADSVLEPLRRYDAQHQTDLRPTLRAYMSHNCNSKHTAGALYVHANTVLSRMRRIEEVLGISLRDPQALLSVQLALTIDGILRGSANEQLGGCPESCGTSVTVR